MEAEEPIPAFKPNCCEMATAPQLNLCGASDLVKAYAKFMKKNRSLFSKMEEYEHHDGDHGS